MLFKKGNWQLFRKKLMDIDNSLVAMSMEFETQNQVIQEYENEKASKKKGRRLSNPDEGSDTDKGNSVKKARAKPSVQQTTKCYSATAFC